MDAAHLKRNFPLAVKSGVKIAYGTDLGQGDHGREFSLMIDNRLAPAQALFAATRPLQQPAEFERVTFVMKGGVVYRRDGAATP